MINLRAVLQTRIALRTHAATFTTLTYSTIYYTIYESELNACNAIECFFAYVGVLCIDFVLGLVGDIDVGGAGLASNTCFYTYRFWSVRVKSTAASFTRCERRERYRETCRHQLCTDHADRMHAARMNLQLHNKPTNPPTHKKKRNRMAYLNIYY